MRVVVEEIVVLLRHFHVEVMREVLTRLPIRLPSRATFERLAARIWHLRCGRLSFHCRVNLETVPEVVVLLLAYEELVVKQVEQVPLHRVEVRHRDHAHSSDILVAVEEIVLVLGRHEH